MLLFLRKILFYALLAVYIVITPWIIFYALGYNVQPKNKAIVRTGLISVISKPGNAEIFVNDKLFSGSSPAIISDLLPGTYDVRLERKGYQPWEKKVQVQPEIATQLEPVVLLPLEPEVEAISARSYQGLLPELREFKLAAWENSDLFSVRIIDLFFKHDQLLSKPKWLQKPENIVRVYSKNGAAMAIVETENLNGTGYWLLNPSDDKTPFIQINSLILEKPDLIDWDPRQTDQFYYLHSGLLSRADLDKQMVQPDLFTGVLGFGVKSRHLVVLKKDFSLFESDSRGRDAKPLLQGQDLTQKIFSEVRADYYHIDIIDRDLLLFLSDRGALITNRLPYILLKSGVRGTNFSKGFESNRALFWTRNSLGVLDFSEKKDVLFERGVQTRMVYAKGKNIRQAFWIYNDTHIVMVDEDGIHLVEANGPAPYYVRDLGSVREGTYVEYSELYDSLFYLDGKTGYLVKRKIVE